MNGRSWVKKSRDIFYEGSTITYNDGKNESGKESIFIEGPLKRNLFVDVRLYILKIDVTFINQKFLNESCVVLII